MTVVGYGSSGRTLLQAVNRVIMAIGENEAVTLLNATKRVKLAMRFVQDARDEVFYRTLWEFRRGFFRITLVENQMWYELPEDYHKIGTGPSFNDQSQAPSYLTYEDVIALHPDLRSFPPGAGVTDINTALQLAQQSHNFGTPKHYTIVDGYIGLAPIPDEGFLENETSLYCSYWKAPANLTSDNDQLGLPANLYLACDYLALAGMKKALEYSDWSADKQLGEIELRKQSNEKIEPDNFDIYNSQSLNYNE
jgi:hypothetical protein